MESGPIATHVTRTRAESISRLKTRTELFLTGIHSFFFLTYLNMMELLAVVGALNLANSRRINGDNKTHANGAACSTFTVCLYLFLRPSVMLGLSTEVDYIFLYTVFLKTFLI